MSGLLVPAIVLTVKDVGEADRLVTFLTAARGRLTGLARHARRSRKRFAHCLEPLSRVNFVIATRRRGDLEFLQEGELIQAFASLRRDLPRLAAAAVLAEAAGELASPPEAAAPIFAALETALEQLEQGTPADSLLPACLVHLVQWGGYGLKLDICGACGGDPKPPFWFSAPGGGVLCGACAGGLPGPRLPLNAGSLELLRQAHQLPQEKLSRLRFPPLQGGQCLTALRLFLRHHLGRELRSWSFWDRVGRSPGSK
ncbi:MAG: DNA repair protein RecO [Deltaproteobacteria bacterium]|nr:DNA repair protein RecO [Deltaproteobacteria bacterium]